MAALAFEILAIPANQAAVERVFSQLNMCISGRNNRSGPDTVREQCFLRYSKKFA
jgi:hypothetical protein